MYIIFQIKGNIARNLKNSLAEYFLLSAKAELLQVNHTPIICLTFFIKVQKF